MMKPRFKPLLLSAALLGILGTTATAWAMSGHHNGCSGIDDGPRAEQMQAHKAQHMAERAERLKTALQLSPSQETAWQAFQTAMQAQPGVAHLKGDQRQWADLTTPQRLERMQQMHQERLTHMAQRFEAVKAFYAVLTPEQQRVFDQQFHARGRHANHGQGHQHQFRG